MKTITLLSLLAVGSAAAGEPTYDKSPIMPPPAPSLYQWFAGATVGYLIENEEEMYTAHIGVDLPNQLAGWDQALYLEIGYTELGGCLHSPTPQANASKAYEDNFFGNLFQYGRMCIDLEIIPVTLNYKLERPIGQSLNAYLGLGAGAAFIDADASTSGSSSSDDDTVFFAQAFGGILYNVNPSFEIYAGARVIYFDEPEFNLYDTSVDLDDFDDFGFEVHNTDVLVEVGARVNF
jgi:opacity protein-like surface antigen